jgi:hypothetical protein
MFTSCLNTRSAPRLIAIWRWSQMPRMLRIDWKYVTIRFRTVSALSPTGDDYTKDFKGATNKNQVDLNQVSTECGTNEEPLPSAKPHVKCTSTRSWFECIVTSTYCHHTLNMQLLYTSLVKIWKLSKIVSEVEVTLQLTVGRSVSQSVSQSVSMSRYRAHSGTCDQILFSVRRLFSESCCFVSVGRPLWWEVSSSRSRSLSRSHVTTDSQSVCQGIEPTLGLVTRYNLLSEGCFLKFAVFVSVGRPLWREVGLSSFTACSNLPVFTSSIYVTCVLQFSNLHTIYIKLKKL